MQTALRNRDEVVAHVSLPREARQEPVHVLLATAIGRPLLAFGPSSGSWWSRGLVSAGYPLEVDLAVHGLAHAAGGGPV